MKNKILLFLFGVGLGPHITFVGQLSLAEILAFLTLPFINYKTLLFRYSSLLYFLIAYAVLLLSLIFSDMYNESDPQDYLRGWATIIFSATSVIFLISRLDKNINYCVFYLLGFMITKILWEGGDSELDFEIFEENPNYFKARLMGFVNPMILLITYFLNRKNKGIVLLLLFSYTIFCFFVDARSNGLIFLIATVLLFLKRYRIKIRRNTVIIWMVLFLSIGYTAYYFYVERVLYHDFGGTNAKNQLTRASNPYNPFELLFQGRMEVFIALQAIKDNPLIGYGSWGKDPDGKYIELQEMWLGREFSKEKDYIPGHSVIFIAWLWGGLLGFFAIMYIFILLIRMGIYIYKKSNYSGLLIIIFLLFIEMIWHFIFSPFGYIRTSFPSVASFLIVYYTKLKYSLPVRNQNK